MHASVVKVCSYFILFSLQFIWEQLYKPSPVREVGTLYHLRQLFHMTNVYASVKKNYKSAENLMLSATKAYICCSFMKFAGLENLEDAPSKIELPPDNASDELKAAFFKDTIGQFVDKYVMVEFTVEKSWEAQQKKRLEEKKKDPMTCTVPSSLPALLPGTVRAHININFQF